MNYYDLKSALASGKGAINLKSPSESFYLAAASGDPYIQPTFDKVFYPEERPTVILVSAVGATGKTALARQLSIETGLPVLDLGRHKPVGDNTLSGVLMSAFDMHDVTGVLEGLANGKFGLVIDGLDEGRAKTNAKAFEAFLDDVAARVGDSSATTLVLLGRSQTVDDAYLYLSELGVSVGLLEIEPFDVASATRYIDESTGGLSCAYAPQYKEARDLIIEELKRAFGVHDDGESGFLTFIGYPPVLDAIVTLLTSEPNYHRLIQTIRSSSAGEVEVDLLRKIAEYILEREREEKTLPTIVTPLAVTVSEPDRARIMASAFASEEQCLRLVAYCLEQEFALGVMGEAALDEKYEEQLAMWMPEHPFLSGRSFRNVVFEALSLAKLISSPDDRATDLVMQYVSTHKPSYHLVYMLDAVSGDRRIPLAHVGHVLLSAMEFQSSKSTVELRVDGPEPGLQEAGTPEQVEIEIEIILGEGGEDSKTFAFQTELSSSDVLGLGPRLAGAYITVPCCVELGGGIELELGSPLEIVADSLLLRGESMSLRSATQGGKSEVILQATRAKSEIGAIQTNSLPFHVVLLDLSGVSYPLIQHVEQGSRDQMDDRLLEKYMRLRRILMAFRSHSKGSLARLKDKIEGQRVLQNEVGRAVLEKLIAERIIYLKDSHYHLDAEALHEHLGVSWLDLRKGLTSSRLIAFLQSIDVS